ncbi:MAG: hypothetical protein IJR82_02310 [Bacilli bacterium]|nr:hypothetical protein [Bacilli bacterium]
MQVDFSVFLQLLIYIFLAILIVIFIILGIRMLKVLTKVDKVIDQVEDRIQKTDNVFGLIDKTADLASNVSDKIIGGIFHFICNIFKKKGNDKDE